MGQSLTVASFIAYVILLIFDGGMFIPLYSLMTFSIIGSIAAVVAILNKRFIIPIFNVILISGAFVSFLSVA